MFLQKDFAQNKLDSVIFLIFCFYFFLARRGIYIENMSYSAKIHDIDKKGFRTLVSFKLHLKHKHLRHHQYFVFILQKQLKNKLDKIFFI